MVKEVDRFFNEEWKIQFYNKQEKRWQTFAISLPPFHNATWDNLHSYNDKMRMIDPEGNVMREYDKNKQVEK